VPDTNDLPARVDAVLTVIYLIFNEGYAATRVQALVRANFCAEAIRLGHLVRGLMAPTASREVTALVALMLLQNDSRRDARLDQAGDLVLKIRIPLLNRQQIAEALLLVESKYCGASFSLLAVQAAIAALHCQAARAEETDCCRSSGYDVLERLQLLDVKGTARWRSRW